MDSLFMLGQLVLFVFQVVFFFYGILAFRKYLGFDKKSEDEKLEEERRDH